MNPQPRTLNLILDDEFADPSKNNYFLIIARYENILNTPTALNATNSATNPLKHKQRMTPLKQTLESTVMQQHDEVYQDLRISRNDL